MKNKMGGKAAEAAFERWTALDGAELRLLCVAITPPYCVDIL